MHVTPIKQYFSRGLIQKDTLQHKMCPHVQRRVLGVLVPDAILASVAPAHLHLVLVGAVHLELDQPVRIVQHHLIQSAII